MLVMGDPAEDDPTVAVEELRPGRPRGGVVVDAGPLDLRAVPLRRRVVDGEEEWSARVDAAEDAPQEHGGQIDGLAADAVEEVVVGSEALAHRSGPPPTGGGAASRGHQDSRDDTGQPPG